VGCTWRNLPEDFPAWQTVYTYFRNWRKDGTWVAIHEKLRDWVRSEQGRKPDPSEAIIDSQSVKTAAMLNQSVGYDAGKKIKGRKRAARFGGKLPPKSCLVDGGFTGDTFMMWVMDLCRWVVERTFGWLSWCRRLSRDREGLPETSEMWIYIAMIRIMVRRLA
jgi:transposase